MFDHKIKQPEPLTEEQIKIGLNKLIRYEEDHHF